MKATALANSNIALVKYWGKRDEGLILPLNSSISMTLDKLHTTTTVEFSEKYRKDSLEIGWEKVSGEELQRAVAQLGILRRLAKTDLRARVVSESNFPKAAGLASSASGFAALTLAASKALGLHLDKKELGIIARQGSGSACRSVYGGFVEWEKGSMPDGSDSYARQLAAPEHWPELCMVVTVLTSKEKKVKSRAGMAQTVKTSPFYKAWLETVEADLSDMRRAIDEKDFRLLGRTAQLNCLKMHATMQTTVPPIIYWAPQTIAVMKEVLLMREEGLECFFTIDGGPQVKILCLEKDAKKIMRRVAEVAGVEKTILCHCGEDAKITGRGLF